MPTIRRKGLAGIFRDLRNEASNAADQLERVGQAVSGVADEAEKLSKIQAPGTFGAPPPRALPGPFSPIVGAGGSTIGGRRTSTSSSGGSGGSSSGSGGGRGFTAPDMLGNLAGTASMPREWVEANCRPIKLRIPKLGSGGAGFIPGDIGGYQEVDAWSCPHPWGTFLAPRDFPKMSSTSSGGAGHTGSTVGSNAPGRVFGRDFGGTGISGPIGREVGGSGGGGSSSGGLQSGGQGLSAPGVESRLDKTNTLLEKAIRGDGGTGLRAGGLI